MDIMEELASIASTRPEELKRQKEKGVKIVGYTGRSVPEELIYASGAIPYLLCRGGDPEPPESTLPYMLRILSPYARTQMGYYVLDLDPVIPLLDVIIAECSDCHMARLADLFEYFKLPTARLGIPPDWKKTISYDYYHGGLVRLRSELETLTGNKASDDKLREAIESINKIRGLLRKISALREQQPPPVGGHDFIRLNHYAYYCDKAELALKLSDLYEELKGSKSPFPQGAPRILLAGRVVAVGDYVVPQLIESSGGVVVADFLDEGTMQCQWDVEAKGDLMRNIAETYYLKRTPPSVFQPAWDERLAFMKKLIKDSRIDGVVWYQLSFEEIYDMEYSIVSKAMSEMNIPILKLESSYEYSREAMGPLTTRIESFVESIKKKGE
jgi:benzoyl-CoA reductase/2-hydroxyglutaryl-CoA dehydratase subunit BcrC/BadD/HgdB